MWRFLVIHAICVALVGSDAMRSVSLRGGVSNSIRNRHLAFVIFLVVMNLSGIARAVWTVKQLLMGSLIVNLGATFSALRDLPYGCALLLWLYAVVVQCYALEVVRGLVKLRTHARRRYVKICPHIMLADCLVSYIFVRGRDSEFGPLDGCLALGLLGMVIFGYWSARRFYQSKACDCLFESVEDRRGIAPA